ncbi:MAG TPA: hypothetical protein PLU87_06930 [Sedimentisphaerales bacterium]|nr:hypothetical protein [Sedimentisphaerales bacterium]HRS10584.1 hypothetical protein [Sedimentisphaerales bacterium]HRV47192.1 hypothetical protein [Sedimentisphaerales bacterium]
MVAFDGSELCREAEPYYFDYLQDPRNVSVPRSVACHIEACPYCRSRVQSLRELLCDLDGRPRPASADQNLQLIHELRSHFEYVDEPITCEQVKPFLGRLLTPSVRIRIPTPITAHIDQCEACARDLESLRRLEPRIEQLTRLGPLLGRQPQKDPCLCLRARSHVAALALLWPEGIPPEILDHLCECPRCRREVYRRRQHYLDHVRFDQTQTTVLCCEEITTAELLDWAIPYGRRPESFRTERQQAVREHVRSCPLCLERMQQIHRIVADIAERADSGVTTVYAAKDYAGTPCDDAQTTSSETSPLDVQVPDRDHVLASKHLGIGTLLTKCGVYGSARGPLSRVAFLAAAMIPLAVLFALSLPAASALSVRQVDRVLARTRAVHVSVFGEDKSKPIQQLWISRAAGLVISELASERRIHDLRSGQTTIIPSGRGTFEYAELDSGERETIERSACRFLEFSLDSVPLDAELILQPGASSPDEVGLEIYELAWNQTSDNGTPLPRKLRLYIDPVKRLPVRQEFSSWVPATNDWHVQTTLYEYPDEEKIETRRQALLSVK